MEDSPRQGQNPGGTPRKEDGFRRLFQKCLAIAKFAQPPYWHIDLHAGCGFNDIAKCEGSPLVFMRAALGAGRPFRAYFCDDDQDAIGKLHPAILATTPWPDDCSVTCRCSDNADMLCRVAEAIHTEERRPDHAVGTCLIDPNGYHGLPFAAIAKFATAFPKIDIILNVNISLFKMAEGCKRSSRESIRRGFLDWPEVAELTDLFPRPHWWVRNPPRGSFGTGMRFTILYGRSLEMDRHRFADFFYTRTRIGQDILRTLRHNSNGLFPFMDEEDN